MSTNARRLNSYHTCVGLHEGFWIYSLVIIKPVLAYDRTIHKQLNFSRIYSIEQEFFRMLKSKNSDWYLRSAKEATGAKEIYRAPLTEIRNVLRELVKKYSGWVDDSFISFDKEVEPKSKETEGLNPSQLERITERIDKIYQKNSRKTLASEKKAPVQKPERIQPKRNKTKKGQLYQDLIARAVK